MNEISLQRARKAYERFKLQWMIDHGFTLADLIACMEDMVCEDLSGSEIRTSLPSLFADWEYGVGFAGGSVWPCLEEYLQSDIHSEDGAKQYLLISVYEREIATKLFATFQEARDQMLCELKKEFCKDNAEDDWYELAELQEYDCDDFSFSEKAAWSNLDDDCNCDWLIVEIS
jgi:hypothetical protein